MMQMRSYQSALDVRVALCIVAASVQLVYKCWKIHGLVIRDYRENNGRGHWREQRPSTCKHVHRFINNGKSLPFPSLFIEQNSNLFVSRFAAENKCELIMKGVAHICMANQLSLLWMTVAYTVTGLHTHQLFKQICYASSTFLVINAGRCIASTVIPNTWLYWRACSICLYFSKIIAVPCHKMQSEQKSCAFHYLDLFYSFRKGQQYIQR